MTMVDHFFRLGLNNVQNATIFTEKMIVQLQIKCVLSATALVFFMFLLWAYIQYKINSKEVIVMNAKDDAIFFLGSKSHKNDNDMP